MQITEHALWLNAKTEPPFILQEAGDPVPLRGAIMLRNGRLDQATRTLTPHHPRVFAVNCLPFDYNPDAPEPERWLDFLHELWPGDALKQERVNLQKLFGLLLTTDTSLQKIFLIKGPKRSGKGTIARVLGELLGKDNVVNPTAQGLTSEFGLEPLIDKTVAIISDASFPPNGGRIAERLRTISGGRLDYRQPQGRKTRDLKASGCGS